MQRAAARCTINKGPEGSKNGMPNSHHAENPRESFRIFEVPSGNLLLFAIENGHRNSGFTHIVFRMFICMLTRGYFKLSTEAC